MTPYIGDGRAFLHTTDKKYDLVIFALPDSLTLVAGSNQLRLESYLFTQEALEDVRRVLKPGGAFAMYNYYREDWLIGRLANTAEAAFGHPPCVDAFRARSAVIVAGLTEADQRCGDPAVDASVVSELSGPPPVHDDRPFLYLKDASIPGTFLLVIASWCCSCRSLAVRAIGGPLRRMAPYADLACLGAAFLLLETRAVTWSALLFGTTWVVNAIVFAGVLVVVLLAVEVTRRMKPAPVPARGLRRSSASRCSSPGSCRPRGCSACPIWLRVIVAVAIAFGPVFASNIVFATRFDTTEDATGRLRGQPARGHGRRLPRVPRAHRRLPGAAGPGRPALPRRVPARAAVAAASRPPPPPEPHAAAGDGRRLRRPDGRGDGLRRSWSRQRPGSAGRRTTSTGVGRSSPVGTVVDLEPLVDLEPVVAPREDGHRPTRAAWYFACRSALMRPRSLTAMPCALGPLAHLGGVDPPAALARAASRRRTSRRAAADAAAVTHVRREQVAQACGVVVGEVDLVGDAVQGERDRLVGRPAVEVVHEHDLHLLSHGAPFPSTLFQQFHPGLPGGGIRKAHCVE